MIPVKYYSGPYFNSNPETIKNKEEALQQLSASDVEMIRVLEDLIAVLVEKNLITLTDLPYVAQKKILTRQKIREKWNELRL